MRLTPLLTLCVLAWVLPLAAAEPIKATGANFPLASKFNREFVYQHVQESNVFPSFIGKTDQF